MKKVLVVDDEPSLRDLLMDTFQDEGFECRGADHGAEALTIVAKGYQPDLIVSDLNMAPLDGERLIEFLPEASKKDIPVILLSGYLDVIASKISHPKMRDVLFMRKPFDMVKLLETSRLLIEKK